MKNFALMFLIAAIALVIAGGAYWFGIQRGNPFSKSSPVPAIVTSELEGSPASEVLEQASNQLVNPSMTTFAIEENVTKKTYSSLSPYLVESVNVLIWATECCGFQTKAQALEQLKYLNGATLPWDFSATSDAAKKLEAKNAENFKDAIIGIAANRYAVAFHLNNEFLIDKIFMVVDYQLITNN